LQESFNSYFFVFWWFLEWSPCEINRT